jgi:hypothetical protein
MPVLTDDIVSLLWSVFQGFQDIESEHESVVMGLYRFENQNASSIRTLLVTKCLTDAEGQPECECDSVEEFLQEDCDTVVAESAGSSPSTTEDTHLKQSVDNVCKKVQQVTVYENGALREKMIEVDAEDKNCHEINSTITYSQAYRDAEDDIASTSAGVDASDDAENCNVAKCSSSDLKLKTNNSDVAMKESACSECKQSACEHHCYQGLYTSGSVFGYPLQSNILFSQDRSHVIKGQNPFPNERTDPFHRKETASSSSIPSTSDNSSPRKCKFPDKYLIFTRGSETFTPHQIGIKRMKSLERVTGNHVQVMPNVEDNLHGMDHQGYDDVDHVIELHGHIIGLSLSPDDRQVCYYGPVSVIVIIVSIH